MLFAPYRAVGKRKGGDWVHPGHLVGCRCPHRRGLSAKMGTRIPGAGSSSPAACPQIWGQHAVLERGQVFPHLLQLANIESSARKHRFFQLRLTDNIRGTLLGLSANELTLSANSLQTSGSTQIRCQQRVCSGYV